MYTFKVSTKFNKKYDVYKEKKYLTSFGDKNFQHYEDKTPLRYYSNLNHLDLKRKQNYYKRFGKKENAKFESAKWFSHNYLW
jgi:hypothetical protein